MTELSLYSPKRPNSRKTRKNHFYIIIISYEVATATIAIPTEAIPENSPSNQMGQRDPDVSQTVEIYHLRNEQENSYITVYVYKGGDEQLNAQAEEIVNSIIAFVDSSQP